MLSIILVRRLDPWMSESRRRWRDSGCTVWGFMYEVDKRPWNPQERKIETPHVPLLEPSGKLCQGDQELRSRGSVPVSPFATGVMATASPRECSLNSNSFTEQG